MRMTIALQNLSHGASGASGGRWPLLVERLAPVQADVLLLNEAVGWNTDNAAPLTRAADDLGLAALPLPASRSGYHVAILYRHDRLGEPVDYCTDFSSELTHGVATAAWQVAGLDAPFGVAVSHLSPFSHTQALIEAEILGFTASRYGPYSTIGLDANHPPLYGPSADVSRMNAINIARRFKDPLAARPAVPNTDVAQSLANDRFSDAFALLHHKTNNPQFLRATGRSDRIDWIMVSEALIAALTDGQLLDTPEGASDHHGVAITLDTDLL
ncbi:endonuclease/exonuclease/phosphatase family protein [Nonomuraea turkmeniaca]|uniref:Endonuclease/exonuclease/phosphatase family protein n=1 Tax=Nonomuraea turkmeniaca TaxID=103838 RepID=A0A5S4FP16_9ACTN|nr:endonuclease/exonuclease/phosphatase family protein [Nonomuraea turkmeniaca]TMR22487.1 endonuclease/exonuclease/phosphatase family protein [Nonomuraea turkmeniaca]